MDILMNLFLEESEYVDFSSDIIQKKAAELFSDNMTEIEKAKKAFEFVRDEIPHSFDINADKVTAYASDVLKFKTGICHAKSNLLAALLRSQGIAAGFCFQHLTLADDDSKGYCVHCFNAVLLNGKWIKVDARGNKEGVNAQFSLEEPILAFMPRPQYDEYFFEGIFSVPDTNTMELLTDAGSIQKVALGLPEFLSIYPDLL